jgi:hypothetical protein
MPMGAPVYFGSFVAGSREIVDVIPTFQVSADQEGTPDGGPLAK